MLAVMAKSSRFLLRRVILFFYEPELLTEQAMFMISFACEELSEVGRKVLVQQNMIEIRNK